MPTRARPTPGSDLDLDRTLMAETAHLVLRWLHTVETAIEGLKGELLARAIGQNSVPRQAAVEGVLSRTLDCPPQLPRGGLTERQFLVPTDTCATRRPLHKQLADSVNLGLIFARYSLT